MRGVPRVTIPLFGKWCILRTSGPSTLLLARTLNAAGIPAWTPTVTLRRRRPKSKATIEVSAPLVPTFVFAPMADRNTLLSIRRADISPHPTFTFLSLGRDIATVRDQQLDRLRVEEVEAAERHAAVLAVEAGARDRAERAALLRTEAMRRKAMRSERRAIPAATEVTVSGNTPFAGMTGVVQGGDGRSFVVAFGGSLTIEIEAWQLETVAV